jgi:adenylate cyclase
MPTEIERKFLVKGDFKQSAFEAVKIKQGYLSSVPERTVRIRIKADKAFITIKGAGNASGASRFEWEKEIPVNEANELMKICEPGVIDKTRYLIESGRHTFEVDEFYGENQGLIMAEIELQDEDEEFIKPAWLGVEVTGDEKYYNSSLVKRPYNLW